MNLSAQKGYAQVLLLVALMVSVFLGVLLVQSRTNFLSKSATSNTTAPITSATPPSTTGNGAPSGSHYNLNIIGVPKGKTADMTGSSGHRIFVPLEGNCKIKLSMGDFQVLDGNCTDNPAAFQLPNPDPDNTGTTTYSVWARALGKPGGKSTMTPCADLYDATTNTTQTYCSVYQMISVRDSGKPSFSDVSKLLLYVYADLNGDGTIERYPLFDTALQDYFWQYDNQGLKLLQLRFYPISSNVN